MNVTEIMVSQVATCRPDTKLDELALTMWNRDCGCIPVVNVDNQPIGIVTDRDIAMGAALKHKALSEIRADEITCDRPVYTCSTGDKVDAALGLMEEYQVRRLPIVDDAGQLQGILSMGDILSCIGSGKNRLNYEIVAGMIRAVSGHHTAFPIAV